MRILQSSVQNSFNRGLEFKSHSGRSDNVAWLNEAAAELVGPNRIGVALLGGSSALHVRLRQAQSRFRHDLTASHWSHCFLLDLSEPTTLTAKTAIVDLALDPPDGFGSPYQHNGLQTGTLGRYARTTQFPNIALLAIEATPVPDGQALRGRLENVFLQFSRDRAGVDVVALILQWLAHLWEVGRAENPLVDGSGIPAAVAVEHIVGALGIDLTPNLPNTSSCPEAIWQAAKWWHETNKNLGRQVPIGRFCLEARRKKVEPHTP